MADITIHATMIGLPELMGKMAELQQRKPAEVSVAIRSSAEDAKAFADPLCRVRTGFMVSRDQVRILNQYAAEFFNDCPYAIYNELGTYKMTAQPWMMPGFEYGRARLLERLAIIAATP